MNNQMAIRFSGDELRELWATGKPLIINKKRYRVGKMSYGDYFLEEERDWDRPETAPHSVRTLWFEKEIGTNRYGQPIFRL